MKLLKSKKLLPNDVIGIICPASVPKDLTKIEKSVKYFEKLGYRVEVGKNVGKQTGYLAGNDGERAEDLHDMFKNKDIKAIFCARGGYGSARLLSKMNFELIKKNPKIFVGYSDITALNLAIFKKTGLVTFAGPMAVSDFADEASEFTEDNFWRVITNSKIIGKVYNPNNEKFYSLNNKGKVEGKLFAANLTILCSLLGTDFLPNLKDTILLIEDINEPPYKIDRMFNQLRLAKITDNLKGLLFGRFVDCYEIDKVKSTLSLNEVIADYFNGIKIPVMYNIKHGHVRDNITFPIGLKTKINASRSIIQILENAVI
ncbi:MAG: LD-carboxypeptidase [Ignavibacteria bacterium]|jgi:muramoyltetrapeptide carboxypeptidase